MVGGEGTGPAAAAAKFDSEDPKLTALGSAAAGAGGASAAAGLVVAGSEAATLTCSVAEI